MAKRTYHVSHISAALLWGIPYLHVVLRYPSMESLIEGQTAKHRCYYRPHERLSRKGEVRHLNSLPLPKGAVCMLDGEAVSSPELVFLELAKDLTFHQRVLLGLQLCSSSPGNGKALTTSKKLKKFLSACASHAGCFDATIAMRYVVDNSWSVMESLLHMLLTLPNVRGGYGLKGASLNRCITLKKKGSWQKANDLFADLYWEEAKLVVEYDSNEFHNTSGSQARDARRVITLERNGYRVVSVTTAQVYNDAALSEVAQVIAKCLGRRIRIRTPRHVGQKAVLRGMLPRMDEPTEQ